MPAGSPRRSCPSDLEIGGYEELKRVAACAGDQETAQLAERIIRASCAIDYPLDKLEIQVLDDSTDHSADIARKACEEFAAKGFPIKYLHRANREGYKAGALAEGSKIATGEFIAIDAESAPNSIPFTINEPSASLPVTSGELSRPRMLPLKASWPASPMP